jgi:hypothetical protein
VSSILISYKGVSFNVENNILHPNTLVIVARIVQSQTVPRKIRCCSTGKVRATSLAHLCYVGHHDMGRPRVQHEGNACRCWGQLRRYWVSSRTGQKSGGPPAWGFGRGTSPRHQIQRFTKYPIKRCFWTTWFSQGLFHMFGSNPGMSLKALKISAYFYMPKATQYYKLRNPPTWSLTL